MEKSDNCSTLNSTFIIPHLNFLSIKMHWTIGVVQCEQQKY